jgi:hypothetical protein
VELSQTIAECPVKTDDWSGITQTLLQVYAAANRSLEADEMHVKVPVNVEQTGKASERECLT